jgi:VanZ family protein
VRRAGKRSSCQKESTLKYSCLSPHASYHKDLFGILIAVVVLIVYGSLYPWTFEARQLPASPLYILLHSWDIDLTDRRFIFDIAVNLAIYIPLGMSAYLAFRRFKSHALEILAPVALGALLSATMEMIQLFTPLRQCSGVDLANNTLGSALGVLAGFVFTRIVDIPVTGPDFRVRDQSAIALLFCWVSSLLFPLFPVLSLPVWRARFAAFRDASLISPIPILLGAAEWYAVGRLLLAAGSRSAFRWLLVLLLLVPVQFAIVSHSPMPADFLGAALGALLFLFFGKGPGMDRVAGIALLLALTLRGLAPFHFDGSVHDFVWIPFEGLLDTQWQEAITILIGKLFQYGASIWLLHRAGLSMMRSTVIVTVVLAGIEMLQTHIPGHVAEISDPLLAVLLCLGFRVLHKDQHLSAAAAHPENDSCPQTFVR